MKKFLALMFVCAGLTAMAAAPQMNKANFTKKATTQVMKANTLASEFTNPVMGKIGKNALTPKKFFKENGLTPNDNLLAKKAPRRLSDEDVAGLTYLDQTYIYTFNADSNKVVEADPHYVGGGGVYQQVYNGRLYIAGFYWNQFTGSTYYLPLDIDYTTGDVTFNTGTLLDDDTIQGKVINESGKRYRVDTVDYSVIVPEDWDGSAEFSPITGKIYEDGTIEFNDELGYELVGYRALVRYAISGSGNNQTATFESGDTTNYDLIYRGTQFLVVNGKHTFDFKGSGSTAQTINGNVYMYQRNDSTVIAFNLFTFGYPGRVFYIHEDGSMTFPPQYIYDDEGEDFANGLFELDENHNFVINADGYVDGFLGYGCTGNVTPDAITWDATVMTSESGSLFYPFFNNSLSFTNGEKFLLGKAAAPTINMAEGETAYTFTAVANEDGTTAYLYIVDGEGNATMVDNPYVVNRTDVDQTITLAALADGEAIGKNPSEWVVAQYTIPALAPSFVEGDVNRDGKVTIADVTALITALMSQNFDETDTFLPDAGDMDGDGSIKINDVTALIGMLMNGSN